MTHALELKDLRKSFGRTEIIRGCSLQVEQGERVAVIGPNGAGKSTLFNLISGRFAPTSGQVLLNGHRIDGKKPFEINRLGLSRSFQITNIFPKLSVFENLRCGVLWSLGYKYTFLKFLGMNLDARGADSWFGAVFVMLTGVGLFEATRRHFSRQWGEIQEFIEKEMKRRETL